MDSNHIPVALTVAGSDCSGGAGIQADLKTFLNHRVQGLSAVTCIVAETPLEVRNIEKVQESTLEAQLNILSESYPISAAKTGLLPSQASIDRVAKVFSNREIPLVVDPVMIASTGSSLTEENTLHALTHQLLPVAALVTPNLPEAEVILQRSIQSEDELVTAARDIAQCYGISCLVKGGHLPGDGERLDVLWHADHAHHYRHPYIALPDGMHGTGCTLSAAITAGLAHDQSMTDAVSAAIAYVQQLIKNAHTWEHNDHSIRCLAWL